MNIKSILCTALAVTMTTGALADTKAEAPRATPVNNNPNYASIKREILRSIEKGNEYLATLQKDEGYWTDKSYPALTALCVTAALRDPEQQGKPVPPKIQKALDFIIASQKEDGSIYNRGLSSYNTAVSMMALLATNNPKYDQNILKARAFLIKQQNHFAPDNPYNGGIGYGGEDAPPIADLSNTTLALEAIHYSQKLAKDGKYGEQPELDWDAAIQFISRCQHNPKTNDQKWVSRDDSELGGFVYRPAESKAPNKGAKPGLDAGKPQKAYGSMTYAGMQSLIYANLNKEDERIQKALKWLGETYSLDENPGMDQEGLYYYYQCMAKALTSSGIDVLTLKDGSKVDWREDLAKKLITIQKGNGSWVNTNNRWWEADPALVTSYIVLALEQIYYSLPK